MFHKTVYDYLNKKHQAIPRHWNKFKICVENQIPTETGLKEYIKFRCEAQQKKQKRKQSKIQNKQNVTNKHNQWEYGHRAQRAFFGG